MQAATGVGLLRLVTVALRNELASGIGRAGVQTWLLAHPQARVRSAGLLQRRRRLLAAVERAIDRLDSGTTPEQAACTLGVLARCSVTQSAWERTLLVAAN
jgi:hypothetical protein